ncbi:hypothetical protein NMYAN_180049 [Nitrosomonas nitrosa]|uniref:Uncharacterized protein n=1 Tax=Nitrosomonas nitrosa TaxID=52442 RepID=A0A8H8YZR1_9PROT|nr:hypothetical protein NMYAN_180049 [Nitrosomonas nitrosa]
MEMERRGSVKQAKFVIQLAGG